MRLYSEGQKCIAYAIIALPAKRIRSVRNVIKNAMTYTNQAKIEAYLGRALTADELVNLSGQITSISNSLAEWLGRNYLDLGVSASSVTATARYYDGPYDQEVFVDDMIEVSRIDLVSTDLSSFQEIPSTEYHLYPLNASVWNSIFWHSGIFPARRKCIKVTAKFSSGELPAEVIIAATALCAEYIASISALIAPFKKESIEGYSYEIASFSSGNIIDEKIAKIMSGIDHLRKINL
jgi:hypothetical protein